MVPNDPRRFLLFAGGEPDRGDDGRGMASQLGPFKRLIQLPGRPDLGPGEGELPWQFPVEQRACVRLVLDMARSVGRVVQVVDVNRPAGDRDLVERWVTPETVLPLLISPDGRRREGAESFVPSQIRKFLLKV